MAAVAGSLSVFFSLPCRRCVVNSQNLTAKPLRIPRIRASSSSPASIVENKPDPILDVNVTTGLQSLACPICYCPLISGINTTFTLQSVSGDNVECSTCKKAYHSNEIYLDLTVSGGSDEYAEAMPPSTEFFRSPLVSYLYERGWRQNFIWGGFPGREKEFEMAKDYLKPTIGGTILDASCGSGLFSRLFAQSGMYSHVVALDFSENMLRQCYEFTMQETISKQNLLLVRADISRLPFVSSSIDAVHAGAALHCWPSPSAAFYTRATSQHLYLSVGELEDLCRACGLVSFTCVRNGLFVMISAAKPS